MSSEAELNASIDEYTLQLQHVNQAIDSSTATESDRESLRQLRDDLQQLLQLTRESLQAAHPEADAAAASLAADDEFSQFMREIREVEEQQTDAAAANRTADSAGSIDTDSATPADDDDLAALDRCRAALRARLGTKCRAPHTHAWGARAHHNAMISGLDDDSAAAIEYALPFDPAQVRVRVMFTHPTHREMVPCRHYLDGECRFADSECRHSHGELVASGELRRFREADYERLQRRRRGGCPVLVKVSPEQDGLWLRGRTVGEANGRTCRVRLDGGGGGGGVGGKAGAELADVDYADVWPLHVEERSGDGESDDADAGGSVKDSDYRSDDDSSSSDSDSEQNDDASTSTARLSLGTAEAAQHRAALIERSLLQPAPDRPLGEWERHTRGFGSRMLAKYGYVLGTGLGQNGEGIVLPVGAQVLPAGRSLDHCMELREQAGRAGGDLFSAERHVRQQQKEFERREAKAEARREAKAAAQTDVFSFMNARVLAGLPAAGGHTAAATAAATTKAPGNCYKEHTTKSLNVAGFQLGEQVRRKEAEVQQTEAALRRHASGTPVNARLAGQLVEQQRELAGLRSSEAVVRREQAARKDKAKLTVF